MAVKRSNYICYLCGEHLKQCKGKPRPRACKKDNSGGMHLWIDEQQLEFQVRQCIEEKGIKSMHKSVMYLLGQYYATEESPQYNRENAVLWCKKAADAGHVEAMFFLGQVYMNGVDSEQDKKQAIQWYQKAARLGSHEAMMALAHAYEEGDGVVANKSEAMNWYRKVAYETVRPPSFMIGGYRGPIPIPWTPRISSYDMAQRGYAYENGIRGVEKDMYQAISWYKKAAEAGEIFSVLKLADEYVSGNFFEKNEDVALICYREVAKKMICSRTLREKSMNWGEGPYPFLGGIAAVTCWDEIVNWLNDIILMVEEFFRDIAHGAQVLGEKIKGAYVAVKHKLFYKENNKWMEKTTTREVDESEVPPHIRDKVMEQSEEVDLTEELAPMLLS